MPAFHPRPAHLTDAARADLRAVLGDRLRTDEAALAAHDHDHSWHAPRSPEAVAYPADESEVVALVQLCAQHRVPMVPFGGGTSVEGQVLALHGGLTVDFTRMDALVALRPDDLDVTVQPGLRRRVLEARLEGTPLCFPVGPGSDATIGGMISTRASGTQAVRYGTLRENVLALRVVLADGQVIQTASRARKSSAGYDLTRLFVGAEGTLGLITEATLRLHPQPAAEAAAVVAFPTITAATQAAIQTIQAGIPVARIELLDPLMMTAINQYAGTDYPTLPTLFLAFHGSPEGVEAQSARCAAIMARQGGTGFRWATDADDRARLWQARHDAYFAALALRPGARAGSTDVCVPLSQLAACIAAIEPDRRAAPFPAPLVGHVGDGNFHLILLVNPDDEAERAAASALNAKLVHTAQRLGGTCTGEHGIGLGKQAFLEAEMGPALDVMRTLKRSLDPGNLFNPGKIFSL